MKSVRIFLLTYFFNLQVEYRKTLIGYEGKACSFSFVNDARNIEDFFHNNDLPYQWDYWLNDSKNWKIELFILSIGPYWTISLSMIMDSLYKLK